MKKKKMSLKIATQIELMIKKKQAYYFPQLINLIKKDYLLIILIKVF